MYRLWLIWSVLLVLVCALSAYAVDLPAVVKGSSSDLFLWKQPNGHKIQCVAVSSNGSAVAYSSPGFGVRVCDGATGALRFTLDTPFGENLQFNSDGSKLVVPANSTITFFDAKTGDKLKEFDVTKAYEVNHTPIIHAAALSSDGNKLVCYVLIARHEQNSTNVIIGWDVDSGAVLFTEASPAQLFQAAIAFSPDGALFAGGCADGGPIVFDAKTGKALFTPKQNGKLSQKVAFSADSKTVAAISDISLDVDGIPMQGLGILKIDARTGKVLGTKPLAGMNAMTLMEAGKSMPVGWGLSMDGTFALTGDCDKVNGPDYSNLEEGFDESSLKMTVEGGKLIMYDTATGKVTHTLKELGYPTYCYAISRDGSTAITDGVDGLYVWKLPKTVKPVPAK